MQWEKTHTRRHTTQTTHTHTHDTHTQRTRQTDQTEHAEAEGRTNGPAVLLPWTFKSQHTHTHVSLNNDTSRERAGGLERPTREALKQVHTHTHTHTL